LTEGENATYANHVGGASPNFDLQEMSVEVDVAEGATLRVGIRTDNRRQDGTLDTGSAASGWFKVDYFRVELVEPTTAVNRVAAERSSVSQAYDLSGLPVNSLRHGRMYILDGMKIMY
ncbi:MAG: hypothetical protein HUK03_09000, partial [Bacteroidaceae bacterium]|nr:hypothetical protein [Bacteroidaceae bacterium]